MTVETFLQHWVLTDFLYPFLLMFFVVFAVLEKSKLLGENKQLNALVAFVIGLIFVAAVYPKVVVNNMILFLTVSLIVVFVFLLLWGFIMGENIKMDNKVLKGVSAVILFIALIVASLWATGSFDEVYRFLFKQTWSKEFWTNAAFVLVIVGALVAIIKSSGGGKP